MSCRVSNNRKAFRTISLPEKKKKKYVETIFNFINLKYLFLVIFFIIRLFFRFCLKTFPPIYFMNKTKDKPMKCDSLPPVKNIHRKRSLELMD